MTEKESQNKDSVKGLATILLPAPAVLHGYGEKEQSESGPGVESGAAFTEEALEDYETPWAYAQCC
jgi:hypothetical protein